MEQRQAIECKSTISCSVRWQKTNFFRDKRAALFTLTRFHFVNRVQGNNLAGSDLSKKNCSVNLRNVCLKRSDWLRKICNQSECIKHKRSIILHEKLFFIGLVHSCCFEPEMHSEVWKTFFIVFNVFFQVGNSNKNLLINLWKKNSNPQPSDGKSLWIGWTLWGLQQLINL